MERYQELVDQLKGCLEDLCKKKEPEIRKEEDQVQGDRSRRRVEEELKIEEMKLEIDTFEVNAINKFPYLKGFLVPKVRALLECLPLHIRVGKSKVCFISQG